MRLLGEARPALRARGRGLPGGRFRQRGGRGGRPPGGGGAGKPGRRCGPEGVASQVEDFVNEEVGAGVHLVASSLAAALVVPAAVRSPKLFKKLVLVCPTGYGTD